MTDPREIDQCDNSPCASNEAGLCSIYHPNVGCSQCMNAGKIF